MALAKYGSNARVEFYLNDYFTASAVNQRISSIQYSGGSTKLAEGISLVQSSIFQAARGDRDDAPDFLVIITDGKSDDIAPAVIAANSIKNDRVTIIMVGVGPDLSMEELRMLATDPSMVLNVNSYSDLVSIPGYVDRLVRNMCPSGLALGKSMGTIKHACKIEEQILSGLYCGTFFLTFVSAPLRRFCGRM